MSRRRGWPIGVQALEGVQRELAATVPQPWRPGTEPVVGGVWFASSTGSPGDLPGEPAWAAAVVMRDGELLAASVVRGRTGDAYRPGLLALREGPLLEEAVRALDVPADVLLANATGRDHPRGAGLALHLGAVVDLPTIGVTDRPLLAEAAGTPGPVPGDHAPVTMSGVEVAALVRTRPGVRPVVVHPGWRTDLIVAVDLVVSVSGHSRTPEPLRQARRRARLARAQDEGRLR